MDKSSIPCLECGVGFKNLYTHFRVHSLTRKDYLDKYPGATICSDTSRELFLQRMHSEAHRDRAKKQMTKNWSRQAWRKKMEPVLITRERNAEWRQDPEWVAKQAAGVSKLFDKLWANKEWRAKKVAQIRDPEAQAKRIKAVSKNTKLRWQDSVYRDKMINEVLIKNWSKMQTDRGPNGFETRLLALIDSLGLSELTWYCSGQFWVRFSNGKNKSPDFKIHGSKKVIEAHGDYWHKDEDVEETQHLYKEAGLGVLIVWESELDNSPDLVANRLVDFIISDDTHPNFCT